MDFADVRVQWPLYTVLPVLIFFFWTAYFRVWDCLFRRYTRYDQINRIGKMCFRANCNSAVHSYSVVLLLVAVLATDETIASGNQRLHPHYNVIGYIAMCITLAYFSLSLPWNIWMHFVEKLPEVAPLPMLGHHVLLVVAALVYLLGNVCSFYGTLGFACMEISNWFLAARTLAEQLGYDNSSGCGVVNGICLVFTFLIFHVGVCTTAAVVFTQDLASFESASTTEWAFVITAYVLFIAVVLLSLFWLHRVLKECFVGVKELLNQRKAMQVMPEFAEP